MASQNVPLAIVGIGCLFPKADGPGAFWANVKHGVDCVGPVPATHWKPEDYFDADPKSPDMTYAARGAFLEAVDFNPLEFGIAPNDLDSIDTSQLLGLVAARQALNDAGYTPDKVFDKNRISVILGVTGTLELVIPLGARLGHPKWRRALAEAGVDSATADKVVQGIADSYVPWQENSFPGLLGNVVAGRIANKLDLGGTNCVVDAACASSLSAIHLAGLELAAGRCDVAVSGGVDTFNDIFMYMCFSKTPALSKTGDAKPFDAESDGTILGEGLGIVVLKRLADAERDGDRVYAIIKGIGTSSDGKGNAVYAPSAEGQTRALEDAYKQADISPATVELVEAHGTGTKVGDTVEATALAGVFRRAKPDGTWCAVGSVKSMIGHTKAAAGAAGIIKTALALYNKVLPPTLKVKQPVEPMRPGASPLYVNTTMRPWLPSAGHPRRAGLSAFGFGGSNFHAVLEEHRPEKAAPDWDGRTQIISWSAATLAELVSQLNAWPAAEPWGDLCTKAAATRAQFKREATCRLLLVLQQGEDVAKRIAAAKAKWDREPTAAFWTLPEGTYFGQGPAAGTLAVLFPGQGSQAIGMLLDLACTFPAALDALADAEHGWEKSGRLVDLIYPHPAFAADARADQEQRLRATDIAQPAIGAVSRGAWQVLREFGVAPAAFAGHSYGELVALWAAGAYDGDALNQMSRERGRLMASFQGAEAGSMLAVHAPLADIEGVLREEKLDLVIANRNSPSQCVLSGTTAEIARAEGALQKRRLRSTRLPVAAAFHGPLVARASGPFREALEEVSVRRPTTPVFANTTAKPYPDSPHDTRDLLAQQLAKPVDFVGVIENMAAAGVRTFLEVGPGSVLARLAAATLSALPDCSTADTTALDASGGKKLGLVELANVLARLAARGHAVDLAKWEAGQVYVKRTARPGLTVAISGANYVKPRPKAEVSRNGVVVKSVSVPATPITRPPPAPPSSPASSLPPRKLMNENSTMPGDRSGLAAALGVTQQSLLAFQRLQEETAALHRQFLDHQQAALATLQVLVAQQQALITGGSMPAMPVYVPLAPQAISAPPPRPMAAVPALVPVAVPQAVPVAPKPPKVDASAVLLAVVAEKTGYPAEMLGLDMALDADLGIDSIKRVEILSALQERLPDAPAAKPEHLGTLHTLRDIVNFLGDGGLKPSTTEVNVNAAPAAMAARIANVPSAVDTSAILLAVVAEKTGYPADMLGLDMALDADLGIDSIKRVEILSALQERLPNAPAAKPEHLGTLHTLRDIAAFLGSGPPPIPPPSPPPEAPRPFGLALTPGSAEGERKSAAEDELEATVVLPAPPSSPPSLVVRKVVRPVAIDPLDSRPRVPYSKFAPVWLVAEPSSLTAKISQHLSDAGCRPQFIPWNDSPFAYEPVALAGLVLVAPDGPCPDDLPLRAFRWLRRASAALMAADAGAFFATVTRLDGRFGFGDLDADRDPVQGALAGLAKTAAHEWPKVACKAIDVDPAYARQSAAALVEEILTVGPLEVGIAAERRFSLELVNVPAVSTGDVPLRDGAVVVVTGGARGVTAEALLPLARAVKPRLVLLGRTPPPEKEPDWLARLADEGEIKQAVIARLPKPVSPRDVGEEVKRILASREVRRNLKRLKDAGATVHYMMADVQDGGAVAAALADVRRTHGPVAGIVHGAGVLADRKIEALTDEQFQAVYATKVGGLRNLLAATADDPLAAIVMFSSSTGRFGRTGQVAYAAANEVLNKTAQQAARRRPHCRTVAINWGPWDGGMVTPALARVFEQEGVGLIPRSEGGETLWRELSAADRPAEVVVIAHPTGRDAATGPVTATPQPVGAAVFPVFDRTVTLASHPILRAHVINEKAVLPLVLHLEWMAHAAMHGNPGLRFHGCDDLRIFQGVQIDEAMPATVRVFAGKAVRRDDLFAVAVEIRGTKNRREVTHSRAEIVLANRLPEPPTASAPPVTAPDAQTEIYERFLFHGPDLRAIERIDGLSAAGFRGVGRTAPPPLEWMAAPVRGSWLADPLALDAAFQLFILWSQHVHRVGSLPCFLGKYRQYARLFPAEGVTIAGTVTRDTGTTARADIDFLDLDGRVVATMADAEHVLDPSLNEAFRRGRLGWLTGPARQPAQLGS